MRNTIQNLHATQFKTCMQDNSKLACNTIQNLHARQSKTCMQDNSKLACKTIQNLHARPFKSTGTCTAIKGITTSGTSQVPRLSTPPASRGHVVPSSGIPHKKGGQRMKIEQRGRLQLHSAISIHQKDYTRPQHIHHYFCYPRSIVSRDYQHHAA